MESLDAALKHNPDHIPALRAKAVIHARAELLYYDPDLSYRLAARVAKLEPHANTFLLNLSEWMSGEVRFTQESGHRVPHDPLIGLDRSIDMLEQVIDDSRALQQRGDRRLLPHGQHAVPPRQLRRGHPLLQTGSQAQRDPEQRMSTLREMGACYYRMGDFTDAAPSSTKCCSGTAIRSTSGSSLWRWNR